MKKQIGLIVAATPDGEIGYDNTIPWQLKGDLKRFKDRTMGDIIIMGRKTFESIPNGLPGRTVIVVSESLMRENGGARKPSLSFQAFITAIRMDTIFAFDLEDALNVAMHEAYKTNRKIWLAGGARIYEEAFELFQNHPRFDLEIELTTVYKEPHTPGYDTKIKNFHLLDGFEVVEDPEVVYDIEEDPDAVWANALMGYMFIPETIKNKTLSHTYTTLRRKK